MKDLFQDEGKPIPATNPFEISASLTGVANSLSKSDMTFSIMGHKKSLRDTLTGLKIGMQTKAAYDITLQVQVGSPNPRENTFSEKLYAYGTRAYIFYYENEAHTVWAVKNSADGNWTYK